MLRTRASGFRRVGQVASRAYLSTLSSTVNKQIMTRTRHVALQDVNWLQVGFPNWLADAENPVGGAATITAAIEYPVGTFTQLKFSGSASGTIPDQSFVLTDRLPVSIPSGATFYVRSYYTNAAGICYNSKGCNTSAGEHCTFAASGVVDQTMGGTITDTSAGVGYGPCAILSAATVPSFAVIGDSRAVGINDTYSGTATGLGEITRSIGDSYAYINVAIPSSTAATMAGAGRSSNKYKLAQYCTHVICQYGINDFSSSTAATLEGNIQTLHSLLAGKPFYVCTVAPKSSSTDSFATTTNQTPDAVSNSRRTSYNAWVRANTGGFSGFIEIADQVESARDSGVWKAPSYTTDGLHESQTAAVAIQSSGAVNPAALL